MTLFFFTPPSNRKYFDSDPFQTFIDWLPPWLPPDQGKWMMLMMEVIGAEYKDNPKLNLMPKLSFHSKPRPEFGVHPTLKFTPPRTSLN